MGPIEETIVGIPAPPFEITSDTALPELYYVTLSSLIAI